VVEGGRLMSDAEFRARITADDQASDVLDDVAEAAAKLEDEPVEMTVDAKIDQALSALQELAEDTIKAQTAAEALGTALGPELSGKVDINQLVVGFEKAGLSLDEITAKADELATGLRDVDQSAGLDNVSARAKAAADDTDKLTHSAQGANSALANMIGNSAQDLGQLGGLAGSAGVAIGQMAEYAADAVLETESLGSALKSMVAVAGPIAALTLIVGTITGLIGQQQAAAAAAAERTKQFGDAMNSASDDAEGLADSLRKNSEQLTEFDADATGFGGGVLEGLAKVGKAVPLLGGLIGDTGQDFQDLVTIMNASGVSIYDFSQALQDGGKVGSDFERQIRAAANAGKITDDQYAAMSDALRKYSKSVADANAQQKLFNVDQKEANAILGDLTTQADPLSKMGSTWQTLFADMADGSIDTKAAADAVNQLAAGLGLSQEQVIKFAQQHLADDLKAQAEAAEQAAQAAQDYATVLASSDWGASTVNAAVAGYQQLAAAQFGLTDINSAVQASYDDLSESVKKNGFTFDVTTQKGRDNQKQLEGLYQTLLPQLSAAFADSGGSIDTFGAKMDDLRSQVFQQLDTQTGLTKDQINEVISRLGVFDGSTYSSTFQLLGTEDATTKLGLLSGVISSLPPVTQKQVALDIIAGDPAAAVQHIQDAVSGGPQPTTSLGVDTNPAFAGLAQWSKAAAGTTATTTTDTDTGPADKGVDKFAQTTENTTPVVKVDANTATAIATMIYLKVLAAYLQPVVTVDANIGPAIADLFYVASLRPRVPVTAYLSDYPSAGDIAGRIGTIRVPVDAYLRSTPRINGSLDGG
jgi:hypothetical protein